MAGITLSELLKKMIEMGGSDLHITTNSAPRVRVQRKASPAGYAAAHGATRNLLRTACLPTPRSIASKKNLS